MEILYGRCAGLDVHKKSVSACIQITDGNHTRKETATFRTFTADLERLCKWLEERQVNQVALESTGVLLDARVEHSRAQCGRLETYSD